jgi:hypothetical protein
MATLTADPSWNLDTLNTFVAQQENFLRGPLTKIGNDGTNTTLDIDDVNGDKPTKNTIITISSVPAGATKLNTGNVFISSTLVVATAYRPA